jgi:hypothetical protein
MRLAWCRAAPTSLSLPFDDTAALIAELTTDHDVTVFDRGNIHDLVRLAFRQPFDLHVYELTGSDDEAFLWPYVMHYPGLLRLRTASLHHSRATALTRQRRDADRRVELLFGQGDLSGPPVLVSRAVVVSDDYVSAALRRSYPGARVRVAPLGLGSSSVESPTPTPSDDLRVGVLGHASLRSIQDAVDRARRNGGRVRLVAATSPDHVLRDADVVLVLPWPPADDLTSAIAAMAHGRPIVLFDTVSTAAWPTFDPQTWLSRGLAADGDPIAIAIDPRDEEHSLAIALRRLASDTALRDRLRHAAYRWWQQHATLQHAATAWRRILAEAATLPAPSLPSGFPAHLTADGTARAREILADFGVEVDFMKEAGGGDREAGMG